MALFCSEEKCYEISGEKIIVKEKIFVIKDTRFNELNLKMENCISCHDGTVSKGVIIEKKFNNEGYFKSHPIDIPYPNEKKGYVPKILLDKDLILVDGNISCITCHNENEDNENLKISENKSGICSKCHIK